VLHVSLGTFKAKRILDEIKLWVSMDGEKYRHTLTVCTYGYALLNDGDTF